MARRLVILMILMSVAVVAVTVLGTPKNLQISITDPRAGSTIKIGDKVNIRVKVSNLMQQEDHWVWFYLKIRKEDWPESGARIIQSFSPGRGEPLLYPNQRIRPKNDVWEGIAVVWDTALLFSSRTISQSKLAPGRYYIQIGVAEIIHNIHGKGAVLSPEVPVVLVEAPPTPTPTPTPTSPLPTPTQLRIAPYTKPPYWVGRGITFKIVSPPEPDQVFKSFQWDFGDKATSDMVIPTHWYYKAGAYNVKLTAWPQAGHLGKPSQSNIIHIKVELPPPPVAVTREIMGFPSSCTNGGSVVLPHEFDVQIRLTITVNDPGRAAAFVVREKIPVHWHMGTITLHASDKRKVITHKTITREGSNEFTWQEWLFQGPFGQGEALVIDYVLSSDANIPLGSYKLDGEVAIGFPAKVSPIAGSSAFNVVVKLPIEVVIANITWADSPKESGLQPTDFILTAPTLETQGTHCTISDEQLQIAILLWKTGTPVPYTGGQTISYEKLLELIAYHQAEGS